jgi:hypothetical protein
MFERSAVQSLIDEICTVPHTVRILSPYSFDIRPEGFEADAPSYRVSVGRGAFRLKAEVVPDPMSIALRAAVVAGAQNVPGRVDRLIHQLEGLGWTARIELSGDAFEIGASDQEAPHRPEEEQVLGASTVAVALSEFVLDQLVVTRPAGEMRTAVERNVPAGEPDHDPWLYDPDERDRATARHRALENWLMTTLRDEGVEPLDPAGEPYFDVAWRRGTGLVVCEVKTTSGAEVTQMRLGIGQVLHYQAQLRRALRQPVAAALLVEGRPSDPLWLELCDQLGIVLFWPDSWGTVAGRIGAGIEYPLGSEF